MNELRVVSGEGGGVRLVSTCGGDGKLVGEWLGPPDGLLVGSVAFDVVAEGGEHFLAADGEVVCADGSLVSLSGEAADGSYLEHELRGP